MILLSDAGKRFNRDWVFRNLSYQFNHAKSYAIIGPNGSGKSTLLMIIAGAMIASEGTVQYFIKNIPCTSEDVFKFISITTPTLELIEEMTLLEFLNFHNSFKPLLKSIRIEDIIVAISLEKSADKQIRNYSSGMKQRVKLAQAIFSDTPFVLLDEPCTNLDAEGVRLYNQLIEKYCSNRLVIVSSNNAEEYEFCNEKIDLLNYK